MSLIIPFSEACERNKDPILEVLSPYLAKFKSGLEIGSGTGQHIAYFAAAAPHIHWQPTDQRQYLEGIRAQLSTRQQDNIADPKELDVTVQPWLEGSIKFDLVYTANTLHIMDWAAVCDMFAGLPKVANPGAILFVYGPFKFASKHTSLSNQEFDQNLRSRGVGSAIRDFEKVDDLAIAAGFDLVTQHHMPANNMSLVWRFSG